MPFGSRCRLLLRLKGVSNALEVNRAMSPHGFLSLSLLDLIPTRSKIQQPNLNMEFHITKPRIMPTARFLQVIFFLLSILRIIHANPVCDDNRYGVPHSTDCVLAMSQLVPQDKAVRYFVEEQLRTSLQSPVWAGFKDTRPEFAQQKIVQLPKWTSYGTNTCLAC